MAVAENNSEKIEAAERKVEAAERKVEAAKEEVEAAKEEVEAAKREVEAAKKEVNAGPAQELPTPTTGDARVKPPELKEFKANELLDVTGFGNFVAPNTTADRPLFLRQHLLNVHGKAVEALWEKKKIRLVSLVGCPGTGKTWCGWLVAYTLQKKGVETLHLTIRNTDVTAIANFKYKVCIVDVSMDKPEQAQEIFIGVRQLIEQAREFDGVKFMGLMSGHGQQNITGKQSNILDVTQKLVLWSWTEGEVATLRAKMEGQHLELPPEDAYKVCGGSVRHLFDPNKDEERILDAVRGLRQEDMAKLLALDLGVDDVDKKHRTGLLSFFPKTRSNEDDKRFEEGVSAAQPMPRSDFVIKCIKESEHAGFDQVAKMYRTLSDINPGAAGTAFELLVHLFWREAAKRNDTVTLTLCKQGTKDQRVSVDCTHFKAKPGSIEDYDAEGKVFGDDLVGYFTPVNPRYPVLDSILRYKSADTTEVEVLAIQISIAAHHPHGKLEPWPKLLTAKVAAKPRLALWDFPPAGKSCKWDSDHSDDWELLHVSCPAFDECMQPRLFEQGTFVYCLLSCSCHAWAGRSFHGAWTSLQAFFVAAVV
ncbi:unnamed protein product [Symbiodinium necroappetens]|uniref:Uncharacterized protein n=1 Tax=Symbiodinium necroappetens TaxID=1628268 RepID=A0A812YVE0_9DINO|nr:unnamed protein product [Symbiodinium necroappetens]